MQRLTTANVCRSDPIPLITDGIAAESSNGNGGGMSSANWWQIRCLTYLLADKLLGPVNT